MTAERKAAGSPAVSPRPAALPADLPRNLTTGLVLGLMTVSYSVSFAALTYGVELIDFLPNSIGLALVTAICVGAMVALLSSLPGAYAQMQDAPAAVLGGASAAIAASLPATLSLDQHFVTTVAIVGLATLLTGALFLTVGLFRLGRLVRYLPYPVVGGFMAGTGWLLISGSIALMSGTRPTLSGVVTLFAPQVLVYWLPGIALALAIAWLLRRGSHFLAWPAIIIGSVSLFYLAMYALGASQGAWRQAGLLFGPFPAASILRPNPLADLSLVHWPTVLGHIPLIATVMLLCLLAVLFNTTAIELATGRKLDLDRELRAAGLGNLLAATQGGVIGYHSVSMTSLSHRAGTGSRLTTVVGLVVVAGTLVFGAKLLEYVPKLVVGGLIAYLGISFLIEWVYRAYFRLSRFEYSVVLLILLVVALAGFLPGVAFGLVLTVAYFVISYSRVEAIRHALSGASHRSRVKRDAREVELLQARGEATLVLQLQGYLFFGTANRVVDRIERRSRSTPTLECVILDFRRVTGVDATVVEGFASLVKLASGAGFELVLTELSSPVARRLALLTALPHAQPGTPAGPAVRIVASLDEALERREAAVLERARAEAMTGQADQPPVEPFELPGFETALLVPYLERAEVKAGDYLVRQGETADALYFVTSGRVTARLENEGSAPTRLETMRGGSLVGELGFYRGGLRTASVIADEDSVVYCLTKAQAGRMAEHDPRLAAAFHELIARMMSDRVVHLMNAVDALQR